MLEEIRQQITSNETANNRTVPSGATQVGLGMLTASVEGLGHACQYWV